MAKSELPPELRWLVKRAVAALGLVIRREAGAESYARIERLRRRMAALRGRSPGEATRALRAVERELRALGREERRVIAHSYGLMLETINACENAYRTWKIRRLPSPGCARCPSAMIYVLTAHPTEARSPANIALFHGLQRELAALLDRDSREGWERVRYWLELAWRLPVSRQRRPRVSDEADHIYSILLREETLLGLLEVSAELAPVFVRSWVGGDKDGHPGVDERAMLESLGLSRERLLRFARSRLERACADIALVGDASLAARCRRAMGALGPLRQVRAGDGARVARFREEVIALQAGWDARMGAAQPAIGELRALLRMFPGMVVPLELRESSDILMQAAAGRPAAIRRMLAELGRVSRGGDPRHYARGLIISMASSIEHVRAACSLVRSALGGSVRIPVIPLFEQREALLGARRVVEAMLGEPSIRSALRRHWDGYFEVMLGYSDSAKEAGVLASRIEIAEAVHRLDSLLRRRGVTPIFFHGSGGSTDRGGGSIEEQTAWWPASALRMYKATIQGEMVERAFASPEIARRRFEQIAGRAAAPARRFAVSAAARAFAERASAEYRRKVASPAFLELVERATPYPYLSALKIGSRPVKRAGSLSLSGLRAIPWVMCWTQTRVLFPTWWGVGSAAATLSRAELAGLKRAYREDPLFRTYVKVLGSTLARVELPVWRAYLDHSGLAAARIEQVFAEFESEYQAAARWVRSLSGERDLLWFRPWLGESIRMRSPMIHPLNLLQILAFEEGDLPLIRETATGISSGMLTTG